MPRRTVLRATDLPVIRDQLHALAVKQKAISSRPDDIAELVRATRRPDFALWWVSRTMTLLAAHAAQTMPGDWDAEVVRPAAAGVLVWEGGSGVGLPYWDAGRLHPRWIEAVGVMWWSPRPGHVALEPLIRAGDAEDAPAGVLVLPPDHTSEMSDMDAVLAADSRVSHLWAASVVLALEPKVGTIRQQRPPGRLPHGVKPKHRPAVTIVALRESTAPAPPADDPKEGKKWTLTHQHLVRGHWRQQACGPARRLRRPVFIVPYVKGPEGSGLAQTDVVHVWRR